MKGYIMPIPKKCEQCGNLYECRKDKINTARFCSVSCRGKNAGLRSKEVRHNKWEHESKEKTLLTMQQSFETFFEKSDGCWLWKPRNGNALNKYYYFSFRNVHYKSHRASWLIYRGDIPEGMYVCHKCDVRNCVNPEHLFLGTHGANMKDMARKHRNYLCKVSLTRWQVRKIRKLLALGAPDAKLAEQFEVSRACIWYIKNGKTWKDVK
jgi:hypothetical protein